jgi:hypothetical protein
LALAYRIAWRRLSDAAGVTDLQERPQAIEGKSTVIEERLIHDFSVRFTAIIAVVIKTQISHNDRHEPRFTFPSIETQESPGR